MIVFCFKFIPYRSQKKISITIFPVVNQLPYSQNYCTAKHLSRACKCPALRAMLPDGHPCDYSGQSRPHIPE